MNLFDNVPQVRYGEKEPLARYGDVLLLRQAGHLCYRHGLHHHRVDGKILTHKEMKRVADWIRQTS